MITVMRNNYDTSSMTLSVQDLSETIKMKSNEEVTKEFVNAASFILSAAVAGKGGKGKKSEARPKSDPLWDTKQFKVGQWFSQ